MLLSDPQIVQFLTQEVVPCWEMVRPVPKVSIDFGNGRVLKRTLQGNTVIYLCRSDGRVIDAWPGIYTPSDFLGEIKKPMELLRSSGLAASSANVRAWHKDQALQAIQAEHMRMNMTKAFVESPLLKALGQSVKIQPPTPPHPSWLVTVVDLKAAFAALSARIEDISKQGASVEQLRARYETYPPDKRPTPEQWGKMIVDWDSRNNVRIIRPAVHLLFASYEELPTPRECRDVIFKQILHVPIDDPYLGLAEARVPGTPAGQ